jgi:hypothetical protein
VRKAEEKKPNLLHEDVGRFRRVEVPAEGPLMIGDGRIVEKADAEGNLDVFWQRQDGSETNLTGTVKFCRGTSNLTLTGSYQSITGDGDSSKVRLLLPTKGDWMVVSTVLFRWTSGNDPGAMTGQLFVNDSGTEEDGDVVFEADAVGERGTVSQSWKITTTAADIPVEIKAKSANAESAQVVAESTTLIAIGQGAAGGNPITSDHGSLTGKGDDDHPQYGRLADAESVDGIWDFTDSIKTDVVAESTGAAGVTVDDILLQDDDIYMGAAKASTDIKLRNNTGILDVARGDATSGGVTTGFFVTTGYNESRYYRLDINNPDEETLDGDGQFTQASGFHKLQPNAGNSDDLEGIIPAIATSCPWIFLRASDAADTITIKHDGTPTGSGKAIECVGGEDIVLAGDQDVAVLVYDLIASKWYCLGRGAPKAHKASHETGGADEVNDVDINAGTIDGVTIGGAAAPTVTDLGAVTTCDINGGTIDGVTIGGTAAPTVTDLGTVTTCDIDGGTVDGVTIGGAAAPTVTDLGAVTTCDINGGTIAGVTIDGSLTWSAAQDLNSQALTNVNIDSGVITGITDLVVADGGTGVSTLADHGVMLGSGAAAVTVVSPVAGPSATAGFQYLRSPDASTDAAYKEVMRAVDITIPNPEANDVFAVIFFFQAVTIREIEVVIVGTSCTIDPYHNPSRSGGGGATDILNAATAITSTTSYNIPGDGGTLNDVTIPADSWLMMEVTAETAMILREATRADLRPAAECCQAVWTKINNLQAAEGAVERFETLQAKGIRLFVLWHEGKVEAVVGGPRMKSARGPGYKVTILVVNLEHPDRLTLLDAIVLYCMNVLMSEGYHVIHTIRPKSEIGPFYGRDFLGGLHPRTLVLG